MEAEPSGTEFSVNQVPGWSSLSPIPGQVVEVYMPNSNYLQYIEGWAAFLILEATTWLDGSVASHAYHMGCQVSSEDADLDTLFNEEPYHLHLCLSEPCVVADTSVDPSKYLHVTHVRLWTMEKILAQQNYISSERVKMSQKVHKTRLAGGKGKGQKVPRTGAGPKRKTAPKEPNPPAKRPRRKKNEEDVGDGAGATGKEAEPEKDEAKLKALRDKLKKTRERLQGAAGHAGKTAEQAEYVSGEEPEDIQSSAEDIDSAPEEGLKTGLRLKRNPLSLAPAERKETKKDKKKSGNRNLPLEDQLEALKDGTMKSLSGQLVQQALVVTQQRRKERDKKRRQEGKGKAQASALGRALAQLLKGKKPGGSDPEDEGSGGGKKKKKKKKKKKRRVLKDGVICSSESSSSRYSDAGTEAASSESDLEAPLRKKTRDHPGSVLRMLIQHIKDQMDQTALMETESSPQILTSGIKVMSYFNLFVKTAFPHHQKELHELHHIAAALDLLRAGDVARVGDTLAARYMAVHQSMVDASWMTARHMEIHAMEDSTAAGAAAVLATRNPARLVAKVQGALPLGSSNAGKGRAGKGKTDWHYGESKGEAKGKGKTKKGKNKWGQTQGSSWEKGGKDWNKNQERSDEKAKGT